MNPHIGKGAPFLVATAVVATTTSSYSEDRVGASANAPRTAKPPSEVRTSSNRPPAIADDSRWRKIDAITTDGQRLLRKSLDEIPRPADIKYLWVGGGFDDSEAVALARFSALNLLFLPGYPDGRPSDLSDVGLKAIAGVGTLKSLTFGSDRITDAGFAELRSLTALKGLQLRAERITDAAVGCLAELPSLREVYLWAPCVTDSGLAALARRGTLTKIVVWGTAATGTGFRTFPSQCALSDVGGNFTDEGLAAISELGRSIRSVSVFGEQATDAGLAHLSKLPLLTRVGLFDTRVTDAAVDKFLEQRGEKTRVYRDIKRFPLTAAEDSEGN